MNVKKTFIAGLFSFIPLAITVYILVWIDQQTRNLSIFFYKRYIPYAGVILSLAAIYLCGMFVTSFFGRAFLALIDRLITHVPVLKGIYMAWKQIAFTPMGTEGMFSKVVLVPDNQTNHYLIGFTSGIQVEGTGRICVFLPNAPNPVTGRLILATEAECKAVDMSADEAFKLLLSNGNYIPDAVSKGLKSPDPSAQS